MQTEVAKRHLSVAEVAHRLGVSQATIRRLIACNQLPAVRLAGPGSTVRIAEDKLNELLEERYGE